FMDVSRHVCPPVLLERRVLLSTVCNGQATLFEIVQFAIGSGRPVRHRELAGQAPYDRHGSPSSNHVPPMLVHFFDAHCREMIAPGTHDARHEPVFYQILHTLIGKIEVFGVDTSVVVFPRVTRLIHAAGIEWGRTAARVFRIQPRGNLNYRITLLYAVFGQSMEIGRPPEALAKRKPPGVPQPEERRAVLMLEVTKVAADTHRTVK